MKLIFLNGTYFGGQGSLFHYKLCGRVDQPEGEVDRRDSVFGIAIGADFFGKTLGDGCSSDHYLYLVSEPRFMNSVDRCLHSLHFHQEHWEATR